MDTRALNQSVLNLLWPQVCAHCREDLPKNALSPICLACAPKLIPAERPFCERCQGFSQGEHCLRCAGKLFACARIRAAFLYKDAAVSLVHAFKFRGRREAARGAGSWLGHALPRFPELGRPDALVPMPMHPRRRRERGYNQAQLLAEGLRDAADAPVETLAIRIKETRPLWALSREDRAKTLEGAIVCPDPSRVTGRKLWIIDDVCTSGASLEACAQALMGAGATSVMGYVLARQAQPLVQ